MQQQRYQMGEDCMVYDGATLFPNVRLGRNVTIFPGAVIGRPPLSSGATTRRLDVDELLPVHISDHCVIGCNAVIYMDVRIGEQAIVGAGAVVTRNVAPATVVMGIPAREVRKVRPQELES